MQVMVGVINNNFYTLLVVPLGASHMVRPDTDLYESGIDVRKAAHHMNVVMNLPVQLFNEIGANASPIFTGKITVS